MVLVKIFSSKKFYLRLLCGLGIAFLVLFILCGNRSFPTNKQLTRLFKKAKMKSNFLGCHLYRNVYKKV